MKLLLVVPHHARAVVQHIGDDFIALNVRPGTEKDIRVFKVDDNMSVELKEVKDGNS